MLKTNIERQYEKFIIRHICGLDTTTDHRAFLFQDFHENSCTYYESLCDILYVFSTGVLQSSLWLTQSGQFYASAHQLRECDIFILKSEELPVFDGDLINQLSTVLVYSYQRTGIKTSFLLERRCDIVATTP